MMNRLSRVVPAILTDEPQVLKQLVRQAEGFCRYVQFDIMDGRFVPSHSITCEHLAALDTALDWEVHLMVEDPDQYLAAFREAGASRIIFHYEANPQPDGIIHRVKTLGAEVGLAVNPETPVSSVLSLVSEVDSVLFLAVHPGFYGSPFLPEVMDKVSELRGKCPSLEIGIDGGIKEGNVAQVARVGVDSIYVGSAIFREIDPAESYRRLSRLAEEGSRQRR
jgi:ribulose-phosphate 3-epimerase